MSTRRWRLLVAYDGSGFRGFAPQRRVPTVGGALAEAIARAVRLDDPPPIVCAGRTDAGVHAAGQVAHVDLPDTYEGDLVRAVNRQLAPAIVLAGAAPCEGDFDARHAATVRRYRYLVESAPVPDPRLSGIAWHVPERLDLRAMAQAADPLVGEHDFRAFCRRAPGTTAGDPIVRRVFVAQWTDVSGARAALLGGDVVGAGAGDAAGAGAGDAAGAGAGDSGGSGGAPGDAGAGPAWCPRVLRFDIAANAFCHQMVRSVVSVLVEAGRGRASAASVMALLASGSRRGAPKPAPAAGLCLVGVEY